MNASVEGRRKIATTEGEASGGAGKSPLGSVGKRILAAQHLSHGYKFQRHPQARIRENEEQKTGGKCVAEPQRVANSLFGRRLCFDFSWRCGQVQAAGELGRAIAFV